MELSRRDKSSPETIKLHEWLMTFHYDFCISSATEEDDITIDIDPQTLEVMFDKSQLHQILWNLCQNGLRYSKDYPDKPKVELIGGRNPETQRVFLDVIDHGPGINRDSIQHIFEPFFTTDKKGSGLGLYIARELCESNHANLSYLPVPTGGSCFRIEFSNSEKIS